MDVEESRVTIVSESGSWKQEGVLIRNDPVFRNMGMMHEGGVVRLDSELSSMFESEWPHYLRLIEWMDEIESEVTGEVSRGEAPVPSMSTSLVYLHQISTLPKFINMPAGWEKCVGVDERSPPSDRMRHILLMGSKFVKQGEVVTDERSDNLALSFFRTLHSTLSAYNDKRTMFVYWGLLQNSLLRTMEEYPCNLIAWPTVLWSDVPLLLRQFSIEDDRLTSFSKFMAGEEGGSPSLSLRVKWDVGFGGASLALEEVRDIELYEKMLSTYQDDVDPSELGLVEERNDTSLLGTLDGIVYDVNSRLTMTPGEDEQRWARRFSSSVGQKGTVKLLLSLLHNLERGEGDEKRERMASALEEVLGEGIDMPAYIVLPNV